MADRLAGYQPRVAEHGVLYRVIDEHLETFLNAAAQHADRIVEPIRQRLDELIRERVVEGVRERVASAVRDRLGEAIRAGVEGGGSGLRIVA